jgi:SCY1-like protein 1
LPLKTADASQLPSNSVMTSTRDAEGTQGNTSPSITTSSSKESFSITPDPVAPTWSKDGDLMDVMDDDDDWTGFETAPSKSVLPAKKKKTLGAKTTTTSSNNLTELGSRQQSKSTIGDAKSAMMRKTLAVADVTDDGAWDNDYLDSPSTLKQAETAKVEEKKQVEKLRQDTTAPPSRSDSPASAFAKTPAWDKVGNGNGSGGDGAGDWGAIEDGPEQGEESQFKKDGSATTMTKEEKRAEMERKREERRKRMAQLKESKASKLASGLT